MQVIVVKHALEHARTWLSKPSPQNHERIECHDCVEESKHVVSRSRQPHDQQIICTTIFELTWDMVYRLESNGELTPRGGFSKKDCIMLSRTTGPYHDQRDSQLITICFTFMIPI
jgi:hypothetical protein